MYIEIIKWSSNKVTNIFSPADFILERDSWNDDLFYTYYTLHVSKKHTDDAKPMLIGGVKILKKGQIRSQEHLLKLGDLEKLGSEYCSLGQSLDYYERISQLEKKVQDYILTALNDVVFNNQIRELFQEEEGYKVSLMRGINKNDDIFKISPILLSRDFDEMPINKNLKFKFKTNEMEDFIEFDFDSPEYSHNHIQDSLPDRIAVIVGKNGAGKTTLLSKISRIVFASSNDRVYLKDVASIKPKGLGFPRIISVSYSAFDTFQVPGIRLKEKEQISKDISKGIGRYIFCGVRDISKELEISLKNIKLEEDGLLKIDDILNDRNSYNILKSIEVITEEYKNAIKDILKDYVKSNLFMNVIEILSEESSLHFLKNIYSFDIDVDKLASFFSKSSTGHKFVLHSLASIVQHIENRSLVLFDEPEIHLHPPLLAVLMKSIRCILKTKNSFMILSTHSPVVLQETLSKHVYIVRREGEIMKVANPEIQTFGENIGIITSHIFGLSSELTDYHHELDKVVDSFKDASINKMDKIEELFEGKMSLQARAYIMSKLSKRNLN